MTRAPLLLTAFLATTLTAAAQRQPAPPVLSIGSAIETLTNPHAPSHEKLEACTFLARQGRHAEPAVPALLRQSRYDAPEVRDAARQALAAVLGIQEAGRRIVNDRGMITVALPANENWLKAIKSWESLNTVRALLQSADADRRELGLRALLRMRDVGKPTDPGLTAALPADRAAIVEELYEFERRATGLTTTDVLLDLTATLAPNSPAAAPLVFRSLQRTDPNVAAKARAMLPALLPANPETAVLDALMTALVAGGLKLSDARPVLDRLDLHARSRLARLAEARIAMGQGYAKTVLEALAPGQSDTPWPKLAAEVAALHLNARRDFADVLDRVAASDTVAAVAKAAKLLADGDTWHGRVDLIGRIVRTAGPDQLPPAAVVEAALQLGRPLPPASLRALDPDPAVTRQWVAAALPQLKAADAAQAGIATLAALGPVDDPAARQAAAQFLRHPAESVRLDAARVLGDEKSLAIARWPNWVRDLRSDRPGTRAVAARQVHGSALAPADVTAALLRAVDRRDMPAREGLLNALEAAVAADRNVSDTLVEMARTDPDPARKAYARAALRELNARAGQ